MKAVRAPECPRIEAVEAVDSTIVPTIVCQDVPDGFRGTRAIDERRCVDVAVVGLLW